MLLTVLLESRRQIERLTPKASYCWADLHRARRLSVLAKPCISSRRSRSLCDFPITPESRHCLMQHRKLVPSGCRSSFIYPTGRIQTLSPIP